MSIRRTIKIIIKDIISVFIWFAAIYLLSCTVTLKVEVPERIRVYNYDIPDSVIVKEFYEKPFRLDTIPTAPGSSLTPEEKQWLREGEKDVAVVDSLANCVEEKVRKQNNKR